MLNGTTPSKRASPPPLPAQRRVRRDGDLPRRGHRGSGTGRDSGTGRHSGTVEVGEGDDYLGGTRQLVPAPFGLAVVTLPLEAAEDSRALGAGTALIFYCPRQGEQCGLAQHLGYQIVMTAAQAGEDRRLGLHAACGGLADSRLQAHPRGPQPENFLDERDLVLVVAAVAAGLPSRARKAVPRFPAAQRRGRHLGAPGKLAYG